MPTKKNLRFGIKTAQQNTSYEAILRVWTEADSIPSIEHAWAFDHFIPLGPDPTGPQLEGWTLLAALAARTERLRLGLMVTGNTYRYPAVLANMATTVDIISNGRLDFGIGAGWNELEHQMYGIPLYTTGERIRRLGEACEVIKLLWTETVANFNGKYYQLKDARCEPKPVQKPYPPFVNGGLLSILRMGRDRSRPYLHDYTVWSNCIDSLSSFKFLLQRCNNLFCQPVNDIFGIRSC